MWFYPSPPLLQMKQMLLSNEMNMNTQIEIEYRPDILHQFQMTYLILVTVTKLCGFSLIIICHQGMTHLSHLSPFDEKITL